MIAEADDLGCPAAAPLGPRTACARSVGPVAEGRGR